MNPPGYCPGCLAEAGLPWPDGATSRTCPRCIARLRRDRRVQQWNADHQHQVLAGKARAQQFTADSQRAAGIAAFAAFSARWRASGGLAPLSAEAVRRYVTPELIRGACGLELLPALQQRIYHAWCAGLLLHVNAWQSDDPPPEPDGPWAHRSPLTSLAR